VTLHERRSNDRRLARICLCAVAALTVAVPALAQTTPISIRTSNKSPEADKSGSKGASAGKPADKGKADKGKAAKSASKKATTTAAATAKTPAGARAQATESKVSSKSAAEISDKRKGEKKNESPKGAKIVARTAAAAAKTLPAPLKLPPVVAPDPAFAPPRSLMPAAVGMPRAPLIEAPAVPPSSSDIAAVRRVIDVMRGGERSEALRLADNISEPMTRKLAEWIVLRFDDNFIGYDRYARFIKANPSWPSINLFRRRAEATLWQERADIATIRDYFSTQTPQTAKGMLAAARAFLAAGDRDKAEALTRQAGRDEPMTAEMESQIRDQFGAFLTPGDDKARMERRLFANDGGAALRAAHRLGSTQVAIARARVAVTSKESNARALADAASSDARGDIGWIFAQVQLLRRADKFHEAATLMMQATRDRAPVYDSDQWWIERRLLARKLLDVNDPKTAYVIARDAVTPEKEVYQIEHQFTAGWIALRFLHDPQTATAHFSRIPQFTNNPISLARAGYWLGRAAEAAGRGQDARKHYETAARWTTAYYGQIARGKLGLSEMVLYAPPATAAARNSVERLELVRAAEILYALDERKLILPFMADLGDRLDDIAALTAMGEITARHGDARSMLQLGKAALGRGYPFGQYAFPTVGIPDYTPIAPKLDPAIVFAIVRQESAFDPKDLSSAQAMGLMQVTPAAAVDTCKRFKCTYNRNRLMSDIVYNVQVGAAELAGLFSDYRGSYILTFAAYNAGRGSVRDWIARYGDPRDPNVDPIDWVERIPFSETRNYVQRIMENLQVYRVRFGGGSQLHIEADMRRGAALN
jgi:soluble lytic murein transglycosylase